MIHRDPTETTDHRWSGAAVLGTLAPATPIRAAASTPGPVRLQGAP